jgi:hypothetical protein
MIKISETDDVIDICMDNVFKAVFTKNIPKSNIALSKLLSAVIDCEVSVTAINANEPPIENIRDRQICFDMSLPAASAQICGKQICGGVLNQTLRIKKSLVRRFFTLKTLLY